MIDLEFDCSLFGQKKIMKKVILVYGSIAGIIVGAMFFVTAPFYDDGTLNFDNGMWVGYTSMVIALSLILFGVKSYRDNYSEGVISFGTAFKIGILITLVASVIYALSWEVAYNTVSKGYSETMSKHYIENAEEAGMSDAEVAKVTAEMKDFTAMYENPLIRFGMTLLEIFPVGIVISLISAGLLRKKEFLSAQP